MSETKWVAVTRTGRFCVRTEYEVPIDATSDEIIDIACDDAEWDITDGEWETENLEVTKSRFR